VRRLGDSRARQTQFRRFLNNARVKVTEIIEAVGERTAGLVGGRHVLAIQDTTEVNYQSQADRKHNLGTVGNGTDVGLFLHPVLAVDADDGSCLGLVHAQIWRRKKQKAANYRELPIEKKESYRWLVGANTAKQLLSTTAAGVTIVADRESDIFEQWARLPDSNTHLLSRASQDRVLCDAGRLFETMDAWPEATRYEVDLPSRPGKRRARRAVLAVRFGEVEIRRPQTCSDRTAPRGVRLTAIDVREVKAPRGEEPIHWRLLTTHTVDDVDKARQVIAWYSLRWNIEQLFRTLKSQGLDVESSMLEDGTALERLVMLGIVAATKTMQLVLARDPATPALPVERVFDQQEIAVIKALQPRLEGRTEKQRNPHQPGTLGWASWTIARLGGWTGYASERPPGPITMRNGLQRFVAMVEGASLVLGIT
jgi:Transposase DDE domain